MQVAIHLGFVFCIVLKIRLEVNNGILVLGLNPGGDKASESLEAPNGLAYQLESWGNGKYLASESPIQKQILLLLSRLSFEPEMTLASNLVFYRSPKWKDLVNPNESIKSCIEIWRSILSSVTDIKKVIYIGKKTFDLTRENQLFSFESVPLIKRDLWARGSWQIFMDRSGRKHIVLPHLSRWSFISNGASEFEDLVEMTMRPDATDNR